MPSHRLAGRRAIAAQLLALTLAALAIAAGGAWTAPADARSPRVTFYFGLERPEPRARGAFAAVGQPGSASYRDFANVRVVARRYGARPATARRLRRVARRHGLRARIDASRVFARVSGPKRRFERVLGVPIRRTFNDDLPAYTFSVAGRRAARLPRPFRPLVRELVTTYARTASRRSRGGGRGRARGRGADAATPAATPRGADAATRAAAASQPRNAGTWKGGCAGARATGAYAFEQVRAAYGLAALAPPAGGSVALLNAGEGVPREDVDFAAACFGLPELRPRTLLTDGQARPFGRATFEPQEDLALARGMAPGLESVTFAQAWVTPELWFLGAAQVLGAAELPDTFSISYGYCERSVRGRRAPRATRDGARLLDSLLVRLGLAGVGSFASAGDFGSTCNGQPFPGVAWPASSPYLTSVGGTRLVLDAANARVDEVVWNDLAWLPSDSGGGAGGGGLSAVSRRPPYQVAIPVAGSRRAVPDLSAHASMLPGWPVTMGGNWVQDAGTSASAPLLAGAFAALSARERSAGRPPLGPVNGLVYSLRESAPDALFDVVAGANGYIPKVPPLDAKPGYDRASGLGVPRFDVLAPALPPPAG